MAPVGYSCDMPTGGRTRRRVVGRIKVDATSSVSIKTLKLDATKVILAARRPGGVRVVDDNGKLRFRLSIPSTPLPE
jgi:hypothetical protein